MLAIGKRDCYLSQLQNENTVSDTRMDWSKPNEAYSLSLVLKKNIAYEQTKRPQRQRNKKKLKHTPSTEGPTKTAVLYENTSPQLTQVEHLYQGAILSTEVTTNDKILRTEFETICVAQCSEAQQNYENVCPPSAPHGVYVNIDIVD